jgi:hypothetical protein
MRFSVRCSYRHLRRQDGEGDASVIGKLGHVAMDMLFDFRADRALSDS